MSRSPLIENLKTRELVSPGANVKDSEGRSPLHWAMYKGRVDYVFVLLWNGARVNEADNYGDTPLHWAAKYGHSDCLMTLLERGANVNLTNKIGRTPLHLASQNGHKGLIISLLKSKAKVNATTIEGWTPLHLACRHGNENSVVALLQNGANPRAIDKEKWTPLHFSSLNCNKDAVRWLLRHGARVNFASSDGGTPLHRVAGMISGNHVFEEIDQSPAIVKNSVESRIDDVDKDRNDVTRNLIANGADWDITDQYGKTALDYAMDNRLTDVAMILEHAQSRKFSKSLESALAKIVTITNDIKNQFAKLDLQQEANIPSPGMFLGTSEFDIPAKQRRKSPLLRPPSSLPTPLYSPVVGSPVIDSPINSPIRPTTLNVIGPLLPRPTWPILSGNESKLTED